MGGYKKHPPSVYVVRWDAEDLVKVGFSEKQRWRTFMLRGAELLALFEFDVASDAFALESVGLAYLRERCVYGFRTAGEAEAFLGHGGGGWAECFRASEEVTEEMLKHMLGGHLSICPSHAQKCHVRTQRTQRTHASKTRANHLLFLTARAGLWISHVTRFEVA